jgi:hypothetical protein
MGEMENTDMASECGLVWLKVKSRRFEIMRVEPSGYLASETYNDDAGTKRDENALERRVFGYATTKRGKTRRLQEDVTMAATLTLTATSAATPVDSPVVVAGMACPGANVLYTPSSSKVIPPTASAYVTRYAVTVLAISATR